MNQLRQLIIDSIDSEYEDLLAKRAETLATIRCLIIYIQALVVSLQVEFEKQQSIEPRQQVH